MLSFLKDFRKKLAKNEDVITTFDPPAFWFTTGNYALNKKISGSFFKAIPQGRIACLAGASGVGKSYLLCNILKNAQDEGVFIFAIDSENALDQVYMSKIGMKLDSDSFQYAGVTTFNQVVHVVSEFLKSYEVAYGYNNWKAPKVIIALDSIDMLITEPEDKHFDEGEQKGDQGSRAKTSKHMLRTILSRIKRLPIAFIVTHQVYPNADIKNGQGVWIINNAIKYSCSQILLLTGTKLKEGIEVTGFKMKVEANKTRFAQQGLKVEVEVPYSTGMNKYSGFLEAMEELGIIKFKGAWKSLELPGKDSISFQTKDLNDELFNKIMSHPLLLAQEADEETLLLNLEIPKELEFEIQSEESEV